MSTLGCEARRRLVMDLQPRPACATLPDTGITGDPWSHRAGRPRLVRLGVAGGTLDREKTALTDRAPTRAFVALVPGALIAIVLGTVLSGPVSTSTGLPTPHQVVLGSGATVEAADQAPPGGASDRTAGASLDAGANAQPGASGAPGAGIEAPAGGSTAPAGGGGNGLTGTGGITGPGPTATSSAPTATATPPPTPRPTPVPTPIPTSVPTPGTTPAPTPPPTPQPTPTPTPAPSGIVCSLLPPVCP